MGSERFGRGTKCRNTGMGHNTLHFTPCIIFWITLHLSFHRNRLNNFSGIYKFIIYVLKCTNYACTCTINILSICGLQGQVTSMQKNLYWLVVAWWGQMPTKNLINIGAVAHQFSTWTIIGINEVCGVHSRTILHVWNSDVFENCTYKVTVAHIHWQLTRQPGCTNRIML